MIPPTLGFSTCPCVHLLVYYLPIPHMFVEINDEEV
jgi:hypothetical protein